MTIWSRGNSWLILSYDSQAAMFTLDYRSGGQRGNTPLVKHVGYALLAALYNPQPNEFPVIEVDGALYQMVVSSRRSNAYIVVYRNGSQWSSITWSESDLDDMKIQIAGNVWSSRIG